MGAVVYKQWDKGQEVLHLPLFQRALVCVSHFMPNELAKGQFLLATVCCVHFKQLIFHCRPVLDELTRAQCHTFPLTHTRVRPSARHLQPGLSH